MRHAWNVSLCLELDHVQLWLMVLHFHQFLTVFVFLVLVFNTVRVRQMNISLHSSEQIFLYDVEIFSLKWELIAYYRHKVSSLALLNLSLQLIKNFRHIKIEENLGKAWKKSSQNSFKFLNLEIYEYIAFSSPSNSLKEKLSIAG